MDQRVPREDSVQRAVWRIQAVQRADGEVEVRPVRAGAADERRYQVGAFRADPEILQVRGEVPGPAAGIEDRAFAVSEMAVEKREILGIDVSRGAEQVDVDVGHLGVAT